MLNIKRIQIKMHPAPNVDDAEGIHEDPRQKLDKGTPSITRPVLHPAADRRMRQLSSSMGHTHPAAEVVNCIHQQEMPPDWRIQWQMRQTTHINGTHQTDAASSGRCGKLQQSINRKETTAPVPHSAQSTIRPSLYSVPANIPPKPTFSPS